MYALPILTLRLKVNALRLALQARELERVWLEQFGVPREALPGENKEAGLSKSPSPEGVHFIPPTPEPRFSSLPPSSNDQSIINPAGRAS